MTSEKPDPEQLRDAVSRGDLSTVEQLIRDGVEINDQDKYGMTALHCAVRSDHKIDIMRILIDAGADLGIKENSGKNAAAWAKEGLGTRGEEERVKLLQDAMDMRQRMAEEKLAAAMAVVDIERKRHAAVAVRQKLLQRQASKIKLRLS